MHTTTNTDIDDLELIAGWQDGRKVWFVSDGTVIPHISGGDGDDDDDDQDDDSGGQGDGDGDDEDDDGDDVEDLQRIMKELGLKPGQLRGRLAASKKWERRAKANKEQLDALRGKSKSRGAGQGGSGDGQDDDDIDSVREAAREEGRSEGLRAAAERSIEVYLDAQVEAGRLSEDQADVLLESIDPAKFIDDDGDVDTDKVKALIKGIAKPATGSNGSGKGEFPDTGQGRRNGSRRRGEKASSVAAGRDLFNERRGTTQKTN